MLWPIKASRKYTCIKINSAVWMTATHDTKCTLFTDEPQILIVLREIEILQFQLTISNATGQRKSNYVMETR